MMEALEESPPPPPPPPPPALDEVEAILEYEFKNKCLLEEAFTDSTYNSSVNYERLEYVGDAVLNLLITKQQFFSYPNLQPGVLTPLRSKNVDTEKLARVALKHGFYPFLRHKKPKLDQQIEIFTQGIEEYPIHSNGQMYVPKALANVVESTIGAVFVDSDCSLDIVWKVFKKLLEPIINPETVQKHPVAELHEVCQKKKFNLQFIDMWEECMRIDVIINEKLVGRGIYGSKKEIARYRAARDALNNIETILNINLSAVDDEEN